MTEQLAAAYVKAGAENRAKVVPAGLAFARSIAKRPDLNLYEADKRHPSLMGTYLAAATVVASVYGPSPVGNRYTAGLPADVAAAWERELRATVDSRDTTESLSQLGLDVETSTGEQTAKRLAADMVRWQSILDTLGLKATN